MIKFFRNIRKNLLREGKTTKYFKYALGEIILVVIGILIAVGINSIYSDAQNEKKIQAILKQVQKELVTDIKDAKRIFSVYIKSDSLTRNILNDKVTLDIFRNNPQTVFFKERFVSFSNKKTGYERFIQNLENLPEKYNILLPYFNDLFREYQNELDDYNEEIKTSSFKEKYSNYDVYPKRYMFRMGLFPEDDAKAILDDPLLKNSAVSHVTNLGNISKSANDYRVLSIELYKKIDSLLGSQPSTYPDILSVLPNKEVLTELLGKYTEITETNPWTITIAIKDGFLEINHSVYGMEHAFWNGDSYYFIEKFSPIFKKYKNKKGQHVWESSTGIRKRVFIKTSDLQLDTNTD